MLVTGLLVEWFAGLVPGQATQSPETVWRIGLLYSLLPAILLLVAAVLVLRYRVSHNRIVVVQAELAKRRSTWSL